MGKRIDWVGIREQWNQISETSFKDFCREKNLSYRTARAHYDQWVATARCNLTENIRSAQKCDIETMDSFSEIVQEALDTIDPTDVKNLKEISGLLNQISSTRKNIFNYLPDAKHDDPGDSADWTRTVTITSDPGDAV